MSPTSLPRTLDLRKPGMHKAHFEGGLAPAQLPRLRGLLAADEGDIHAAISCGTDEQGRTVVSVMVDARVSVRCQRCLEIFKRPLSSTSELAVVKTDEEAAALPDTLEPLLAVHDVDLWAVVEDELVLAMPVYSYHHNEACIEQLAGTGFMAAAQKKSEQRENETEATAENRSDSPFDVLAQLKRDSNH